MPNWCWNNLNISGPSEDIVRFKTAAEGPTQTYNDYSSLRTAPWPIHDDIRVKALSQTPPEPGESMIFSFHALYPVPDEVRCFPYDSTRAREVGEAVGHTRMFGGYDWEIRNWGCKWGASEPNLTHIEACFLQYTFETAWAPPISFLEKISEDWPNLSFELSYEEAGMGFGGNAEFANGEMLYDNEYALDTEEDEDE